MILDLLRLANNRYHWFFALATCDDTVFSSVMISQSESAFGLRLADDLEDEAVDVFEAEMMILSNRTCRHS